MALVAVLLGTTSLVSPAFAAPPAPIPYLDWSGNYMGIEGGYGWAHQGQNLIFPYNAQGQKCVNNEGTTPIDCTGGIGTNPEFQAFNSRPPNPAVALGDIHEHGGLIGYFYGWQKQFGSWVAGFEADADFANIKGSVNGSNSSFFSSGDDSISKTNFASNDASVSWLASARFKAGYVPTPDWLIYGTAGLGIAHIKETVGQSASVTFCDGGVIASGCNTKGSLLITGTTSNVFTGNDTLLGWAAGAGIDWKYRGAGGSAWVFGVEYLHYGFPTHTITLSGGPAGNPTMSIGVHEEIDVIKARISYFWPLSP
jgi:outer membrane immunogenic protein